MPAREITSATVEPIAEMLDEVESALRITVFAPATLIIIPFSTGAERL